MLLCNECGSEIGAGLLFCTNCGAKVSASSSHDDETTLVRGRYPQAAPLPPADLPATIILPRADSAGLPPAIFISTPGQPAAPAKSNAMPWLVALFSFGLLGIVVVAFLALRQPVGTGNANNTNAGTGNSNGVTRPSSSAIDPCNMPPPAFSCSDRLARLDINANIYSEPILDSNMSQSGRDRYLIAQHFEGARLCVLETQSNDKGDSWHKIRVMEYGTHTLNSAWHGKKNLQQDTSKAAKERLNCQDNDTDAPDTGWVKEADSKNGIRIVSF